MLRRRADTSAASPPASTPGEANGSSAADNGDERAAAGKGRPTPKRRDAEAARRRPIAVTPTDRKAAREQARRMRAEQRAAIERGDESRMPPRDRGPVRRFTRDFVDSRRTISEYFLPLGVVLYVVLIVARSAAARSVVTLLLMLLVLLLVLELTWLGRGLSRALRERFPNDNRSGAVMYGLTRAGQTRRLRLPKPQVRPGQRPDNRASRR